MKKRAARIGISAAGCMVALAGTLLAVGAVDLADWSRFSVLTPPGPAEVAPDVFQKLKRLVYGTHKVRNGEYVEKIAAAYGTNRDTLQSTNGSELILLSAGMPVTVVNKRGYLYPVRKSAEKLDDIVSRFAKDPKDKEKLKLRTVEANRLPASAMLAGYELLQGEQILLPSVFLKFDTYHFPFRGIGIPRISSRFGRRFHPILRYYRYHEGWDLPKPYGTPVYPSRSGKVVKAGWEAGYGRVVVVRHRDGYTTWYGHLSRTLVEVGRWVERGKTLLGKVGSSGLSTGPHLHFEVRDSRGNPVNPYRKIGRK